MAVALSCCLALVAWFAQETTRDVSPEGLADDDVRLGATLERLRSRPRHFDPALLREIAASHSLQAYEGLRDLYPLLIDPERRTALLGALAAFADTERSAATRTFLTRVALDSDRGFETAAACESLGQFGAAAQAELRRLLKETATYHLYLAASHQLLRLDLPQDRDWRLALARDEHLPLLRRLGMPGHPQAFASYTSLRGNALRLLAREPGATALLEERLLDPSQEMQARALQLLSTRRSLAALARAHAVLQQPGMPRDLQLAALDTLRQDGNEPSVRTLIKVARSTREVRTYALRCLRTLDPLLLREFALPVLTGSTSATDALLALDLLAGDKHAKVQRALRQLLKHDDALVQIGAAREAARRADREALPLLHSLLRRAEDAVRAEVVGAITRLQPVDPAWRKKLHEYCEDRALWLRLAAVEALTFLRDRTALGLLQGRLEDQDWRVRSAAVVALGEIRDRSSVPLLLGRLEKERSRIKREIGASLRHLTGLPFQDVLRDWQRWWDDVRGEFPMPSQSEVEALEKRLAESAGRAGTRARFYGIRVTSDHLTLIIDVSGSMSDAAHYDPRTGGRGDTKLDVAKRQVQELLAQLPDGTHLNILFFAERVRSWQRHLVPLSRSQSLQAEKFVLGQHAAGGTNLHGALQKALADPETDTLYILSDGEPTVGRLVDPYAIRTAVRRLNPRQRIRIHTINIGPASDLMRALAEDSGGKYVQK